MQRAQPVAAVVVGVDTHLDAHAAVVLDPLGALLGCRSFPSTPEGYRQLLSWSSSFGQVLAAGVEGTGSYGAGLSRFLLSEGVEVLEVERPKRRYHSRGKSDVIDAELAARAVLSRNAAGTPKSADGHSEMIRVLVASRRSAIKARTQAANALRSLLVTAPDELRSRLSSLPLVDLVAVCSRFRPGSNPSDLAGATKLALRSLARRHLHLSAEISELDVEISRLVSEAAPQLLALPGVGPDVAATLLVTVGDNPGRLGSEAAFSALCGVSPVEASSGKTVRHRLNRRGDRQANRALYIVSMVRMAHCPRTKHYVARRTSEGKSKKEIIRCLKRYIAREVYKILKNPQKTP